MKTLVKSLSFRYLKKADAASDSSNVLFVAEIRHKGRKMTKAFNALHDVLGLSTEESLRIMELCDTTLDGSKWSDASYTQIIRTAQTVLAAA